MNLPRTTRARPVQLMRDRIIVMSRYICTGGIPAGMAADSAIHSGGAVFTVEKGSRF